MNSTLLWLRIVVALFLTVAVLDLPYSAYSLLRVVTAVSAVEVAWLAHRRQQPSWLLPFAAIAILWNPIREIEFPKTTWQVLDLAAAMLFVLSTRYVRETTLLRPRAGRLEKRRMLTPARYIWVSLATYGSLFGVFFGLPLLSDNPDPLGEPWKTLFLVLLLLLCVAILASKIIYIRHVVGNPNVKYKVVWSLVIVLVHFWSELIYYFVHIRSAAVRPTPSHASAPVV